MKKFCEAIIIVATVFSLSSCARIFPSNSVESEVAISATHKIEKGKISGVEVIGRSTVSNKEIYVAYTFDGDSETIYCVKQQKGEMLKELEVFMTTKRQKDGTFDIDYAKITKGFDDVRTYEGRGIGESLDVNSQDKDIVASVLTRGRAIYRLAQEKNLF